MKYKYTIKICWNVSCLNHYLLIQLNVSVRYVWLLMLKMRHSMN